MHIDREKALKAVREKLAQPLGMSEIEAAWGVLTVLANNCVTAMRTITVERGYDPREFTFVPFGGMGPTIAGKIASDLGVQRLLVPRDPGTFSAWGMLVTDVHQELSQTKLMTLDSAVPEEIEALFQGMEERIIADLLRENFPRERVHTLRSAGLRYRGQSYEVVVPVDQVSGADGLARLAQRFHDAHYRRYGHMAQNETIDIVSFKVTGVGEIAKPALIPATDQPSGSVAPAATRPAYFGSHGMLDAAVYRRADLPPGARVEGPAIFEERTSTVVLYPGQIAEVDAYLNLEITC
jgi:N-methylhydantoinase A